MAQGFKSSSIRGDAKFFPVFPAIPLCGDPPIREHGHSISLFLGSGTAPPNSPH